MNWRAFRSGCERFTRPKRDIFEGRAPLRLYAGAQVGGPSNAAVTRYVTEGVTLPRPDPTRPLSKSPIHCLYRVARLDLWITRGGLIPWAWMRGSISCP